MTENQWVNALIVVLLIIPVFSWSAAAILTRVSLKRPYITGLSERAFSAVLKAIGSTLIAFVILNSLLHWAALPRPWGVGIIAFALFLLEIPAAIWLALYYGGRFRG